MKHKLLKHGVVIAGLLATAAPDTNLHAHCGYAPSLGCSTTDYNNFGYHSNNDPATIEYDNLVSAYHATAIREYSGEFKIWGEGRHHLGMGSLVVPTEINAANFPTLTGSGSLRQVSRQLFTTGVCPTQRHLPW